MVEHRAFGRLALVGSHVVQSLMDYGPRATGGEPEDDEEEALPKQKCKSKARISQCTSVFLDYFFLGIYCQMPLPFFFQKVLGISDEKKNSLKST